MRNIIYNDKNIKLDNGLFFGKGVFETILVKDKAIFLNKHIERLNNSIKSLNLGEEVNIEDVKEIIKSKKIKNKALKITVTENNLIYTTREIKYTENDYLKGFKVKITEVLRNSTSRILNFKTLNYLENIIEYEICNKEGFNEAIFLNEKGYLCEGCTSNIFIIKNKKLYTPKIDCGLLPGIVRDWVINNFDVSEREITKEELLDADGVFLTNSLVGIIKVSTINNKGFNCNIIENIKTVYDNAINGGDNNE